MSSFANNIYIPIITEEFEGLVDSYNKNDFANILKKTLKIYCFTSETGISQTLLEFNPEIYKKLNILYLNEFQQLEIINSVKILYFIWFFTTYKDL